MWTPSDRPRRIYSTCKERHGTGRTDHARGRFTRLSPEHHRRSGPRQGYRAAGLGDWVTPIASDSWLRLVAAWPTPAPRHEYRPARSHYPSRAPERKKATDVDVRQDRRDGSGSDHRPIESESRAEPNTVRSASRSGLSRRADSPSQKNVGLLI